MPQPGSAQGDAPSSETNAEANDSGDDGWETSTELPNVPGSEAGSGQGEDAENNSGGEQQGGIAGTGEERSGGSQGDSDTASGSDGNDESQRGAGSELERALEDLDGEILAERIKSQRADKTVAAQSGGTATNDGRGAAGSGAAGSGAAGSGAASSGAGSGATPSAESGAAPSRGTIASATPKAPRPPLPTPPDTPDAKDNCVVARQIREAAMAETDPTLRNALWKEYERYKSCR